MPWIPRFRGGGRLRPCAAVSGLALVACLVFGCTTSDAIVKLPPPRGLPALTELERHLDYVDPDDGKPDYVRERTGR